MTLVLTATLVLSCILAAVVCYLQEIGEPQYAAAVLAAILGFGWAIIIAASIYVA